MVSYVWDHAVISDRVFYEIKKGCNFSVEPTTDECNAALGKYFDVYSIINMYSLYAPTCDENEPPPPLPLGSCPTSVAMSLPKYFPNFNNISFWSDSWLQSFPSSKACSRRPSHMGFQVGGWTIEYDGLMFVTVRGAGHQVPTFAPKQALQLISHFLANEKLPSAPV